MSIQSNQSINHLVDAAADFLAKPLLGTFVLGGSTSSQSEVQPKKGGFGYFYLTLALGILGLAYAKRNLLKDGLADGIAYAKENLLTQLTQEGVAEEEELLEVEEDAKDEKKEKVEKAVVEETKKEKQGERENPQAAPVAIVKSEKRHQGPRRGFKLFERNVATQAA